METNLKKFIVYVVLVISPIHSFGQYNTINTTIALKQYDDAIILMEQALTKDSLNPSLYYNLGNAYLQQEQYGLALWAYENILSLEPKNEGALRNAQYIYKILDKGDYEVYISGFIYQIKTIGSNNFALISVLASIGIAVLFMLSRKFKSANHNRIAYSFILSLIIVLIGSSILSVISLSKRESKTTGIVINMNIPTYLNNLELAPYQIPLGTRFDILNTVNDKMWKIKTEDDKTVIINAEHARLIN